MAGRVIGAMVIEAAAGFEAPRDAAAIAHQFAAIVAPHLELLRRGAHRQAEPDRGTREKETTLHVHFLS